MRAMPPQGEPFDSAFAVTASRVRACPPETRWMLAILSTINPEHEFFGKDYVKPRVDSQGINVSSEQMVSNQDGFFTGLP